MTVPADLLKWHYMTGVIEEIRRPNQFLSRFLFGNRNPLHTEDIEIGVITSGDREVAPFVRSGAEGVMVGGYGEKYHTVSAPNIRIKRPLRASDVLFTRRPGTPIFATPADQMAAARRAVADNLKILEDRIVEAEEYLCSLAIQGTITYSVAGGDVFRIVFPRPGANSITLTTFWNDNDPTTVRVHQNLHTVKQTMADGTAGLQVTDAICGSEATTAILELAESGNLKLIKTDSGVAAGGLTMQSQFSEDGVVFLGELSGIRFWSYTRKTKVNGASVDLIRPKWIEFVSTSPNSERVMYYGAIDDIQALEGNLHIGSRFAKSWLREDPSARMMLAASRPLPVPRRLDAWVSMKVVSG